MKPIQKDERYPLSKIVSEGLKQYIVENGLKPGEKLPSERDLVKILNVSRSILREALRILESSGVLSIRHGEGAFVQSDNNLSSLFEHLFFLWKLGDKKRSDLLELRRMFEMAAIEETVRRAGEDDLNVLEQSALRMQDAVETKSIQDADIEFHRALLRTTNNELFVQMTELVVEYFAGIPHRHMDLQERNKSMREHLAIVAAIRERDEAKAKRLLEEHFDYAKTYLANLDETV